MGRSIEEITGKILRRHRLAKGVSQELLAEVTGLDRSYISQLETGRYRATLLTIFAVAHALNVSATTIVSEIEAEWVPPPRRGKAE